MSSMLFSIAIIVCVMFSAILFMTCAIIEFYKPNDEKVHILI